jgi:ribose 1,5-bisphosphokinase
LPEAEGIFVAVVGPSGAGKDSLINVTAKHFRDDSRFLFVRRVVTRKPDKELEDHDTVSTARFRQLRESGAFAFTWDAHGLSYGIPCDAKRFVENGGIAVANCSRAAIADARLAFGRTSIVHVAADADILANRLARRGRENSTKIAARLERAVADYPGQGTAFIIRNNGLLEQASASFIDLLERTANSV